jgi:AraC-like DNA-binding protein
MPIRFFSINGEPLTNAISDAVTVVTQEYNNVYFDVSNTTIFWDKSERIICEYDFPPGIFTRTTINYPIHEWIKGAGEVHLVEGQFSMIAGSQWKGMLFAEKPGQHDFFSIHWSSQFISELVDGQTDIIDAITFSLPGLPHRFIGPQNFVNIAMKQHLFELWQLNFSAKKLLPIAADYLRLYFKEMINEWKHFEPVKRKMRESDWHHIHAAKNFVDDNLATPFTTRDVSRGIKMNEFKLKKLFPRITGYHLEDYRKYMLCTKVGRKIISMPDEPIKHFYAESGYSNLPNFSRGFLKHCCCKPTQLRQQSWDVGGIVNHQTEQE